MKIVGIGGLARSGKDTSADRLVLVHRFVRVSLADPLKRMALELFPEISVRSLWGPSEARGEMVPRAKMTVRSILQKLGTEVGREIYADVWIDYALRKIEQTVGEQRSYSPLRGVSFSANDFWATRMMGAVIPDVRFRNEAEAIRRAGGEVWYVERREAGLKGPEGQHRSELEFPMDLVSTTLVNEGTVEDLHALVDAAVEGLRTRRAP